MGKHSSAASKDAGPVIGKWWWVLPVVAALVALIFVFTRPGDAPENTAAATKANSAGATGQQVQCPETAELKVGGGLNATGERFISGILEQAASAGCPLELSEGGMSDPDVVIAQGYPGYVISALTAAGHKAKEEDLMVLGRDPMILAVPQGQETEPLDQLLPRAVVAPSPSAAVRALAAAALAQATGADDDHQVANTFRAAAATDLSTLASENAVLVLPRSNLPEGYAARDLLPGGTSPVALVTYGVVLAGSPVREFAGAAAAQFNSPSDNAPDVIAAASALVGGTGVALPLSLPSSLTDDAPTSSAATPTSTTPVTGAALASDAPTLLLVDTAASAAGTWEQSKAALMDQLATRAAGGSVTSLWNYSSPLNPGVVVGYRTNVGFADAESVANSLSQLGIGGYSYTHQAIVAAAATAADYSAATGETVRLVLVTTGTDDATDNIADQLPSGEQVQIRVVAIGAGADDAALRDAVTARGGTFTAVPVGSDPTQAINTAMNS